MTFAMSSVGSVRNARRDPANSDHWGQVISTILIDERFGEIGCASAASTPWTARRSWTSSR